MDLSLPGSMARVQAASFVWVRLDSSDSNDRVAHGELCLVLGHNTLKSSATYVMIMTPRMRIGWIHDGYLVPVSL